MNRYRRRLPITLAALSSALVLAACGGSSKPSSTKNSTASGPSSASKGSPSSFMQSQLKWAACIRSHGVPSFPDPTFGAGGAQVNLSTNVNPLSPAFQLAQKECAKLGLVGAGHIATNAATSTATAAEMAQALAIATCIRAHGVPNWPDPRRTLPSNTNGYQGVLGAVPGPAGGPIFLIPNSIDFDAPAVKQAEKACHEN
jgi:hypothetical protein